MPDKLLTPIEHLGDSKIPERVTIDPTISKPLLVHLAERGDNTAAVFEQVNKASIAARTELPIPQAITINKLRAIFTGLDQEEPDTTAQPELSLVSSPDGFVYRPGLEAKTVVDESHSGLLESLPLPPAVIAGIKSLREQLDPFKTLTFAREATDKETEFEGRGVYLDIPLGDKTIVLYLKGVGSQSTDYNTDRVFPGFPDSPNQLFYDNIYSGRDHPRIVGTESWRWGMMEFVNLHVLLCAAYNCGIFATYEELLTNKVPIPISIIELPELTAYLATYLDELRIINSQNPVATQALNWQGLQENLVITSTVVPGKKRLERPSSLTNSDAGELIQSEMLSEERAKFQAGTMRSMLQMGILYSSESSHGQNIYDVDCPLPLADYSDFLLLGNYIGGMSINWKNESSWVDAASMHEIAIYRFLHRNDGQRPPIYPTSENDHNLEDIYKAQVVFIKELLIDFDFNESLISEITYLYLLFPDQVDKYLAKILRAKYTNNSWNELAALQSDLVKQTDASGNLSRELKEKVNNNLHPIVLWRYTSSIKHPVNAQDDMEELFQGNTTNLKNNEYLGPIIQLAEKIRGVGDLSQRNRLFSALQSLSLVRDLDKFTSEPSFYKEYGDLLYLFDYQHLEKVTSLLDRGMHEEAILFLIVLAKLYSRGIKDCYSVLDPKDGQLEFSHRFAEKLLQTESLELLTTMKAEADYLIMTSTFQAQTSGNLGSYIKDIFNNKPAFNLNDFCFQNGFQHPQTLLLFLHREAEDSAEREKLTTFICGTSEHMLKWISKKGYEKKKPTEALIVEYFKEESTLYDLLQDNPPNLLLQLHLKYKYLIDSGDFTSDEGIQLHHDCEEWLIRFFQEHHDNLIDHYRINDYLWLSDHRSTEVSTDFRRLQQHFANLGFSRLSKYYDRSK